MMLGLVSLSDSLRVAPDTARPPVALPLTSMVSSPSQNVSFVGARITFELRSVWPGGIVMVGSVPTTE